LFARVKVQGPKFKGSNEQLPMLDQFSQHTGLCMKTPGIETVLKVLGVLLLPISGLFVFFSLAGAATKAHDLMITFLLFGAFLLALSFYFLSGASHLVKAVSLLPKVESINRPGQSFTQTGGARYVTGMWRTNLTAPFATLGVTREELVLSMSFLQLWKRTFRFPRSSLQSLRWKRGLFSLGLKIEHNVADYPSFILFWVSNREALKQGLRDFGYEISDP
jgi:hypothetical protein